MAREPSPEELLCLKTIMDLGGDVNHDTSELLPFCDDNSTLSNPDIFNRCHDLGWLHSSHDDRNSNSYVRLTEAGRTALSGRKP